MANKQKFENQDIRFMRLEASTGKEGPRIMGALHQIALESVEFPDTKIGAIPAEMDIAFLARKLETSSNELISILDEAARFEIIDIKQWLKGEIFFPDIVKDMDDQELRRLKGRRKRRKRFWNELEKKRSQTVVPIKPAGKSEETSVGAEVNSIAVGVESGYSKGVSREGLQEGAEQGSPEGYSRGVSRGVPEQPSLAAEQIPEVENEVSNGEMMDINQGKNNIYNNPGNKYIYNPGNKNIYNPGNYKFINNPGIKYISNPEINNISIQDKDTSMSTQDKNISHDLENKNTDNQKRKTRKKKPSPITVLKNVLEAIDFDNLERLINQGKYIIPVCDKGGFIQLMKDHELHDMLALMDQGVFRKTERYLFPLLYEILPRDVLPEAVKVFLDWMDKDSGRDNPERKLARAVLHVLNKHSEILGERALEILNEYLESNDPLKRLEELLDELPEQPNSDLYMEEKMEVLEEYIHLPRNIREKIYERFPEECFGEAVSEIHSAMRHRKGRIRNPYRYIISVLVRHLEECVEESTIADDELEEYKELLEVI